MALSDIISKANNYIQSYAQKAQNYISDYGWGSGNTWNYSSGGGSSSSSPSIKSGLQSSGGSSYSTGKSYSGKSIGDLLLPTAEVTVNTNPDTSSDGWFYADTNAGSKNSGNDGWNYASSGGGYYGGSANNEPSQSSYNGEYSSPSPSVKSGLKSTQQTPAPQQNLPEAIVEPVASNIPTAQQQTTNLQRSLLSQSAADDNSVNNTKSTLPGLDKIFDENAIQRSIRQTINEVSEQNTPTRTAGNLGQERALTNWAWRNTNQPSLADRIMNLGVSPAEAASDIPVDYGSVVRQERLNPSISEFDEQQARRQALQQLPPLSNADAMRFGVQNTIANSERPNLTIDDAINFMRNDLGISGVNDFGIAGLEPEAERAYALQLLEDGVVPENPQPDFWQNLINNVSNSLGSFGNTESQKAITESAQTTAENRGSNGNYPVHEKSDLEKRIIEGLYNKTYPNIIAAAKNTWYDWQNFGKKTDAYNQYKDNYLNSIGKSEVELTNAERKQLDIDANAYAEQQYPSTHTSPRQEQKNLAAIIEQREQQKEFNSLPEAEVTVLNSPNTGNNQNPENSQNQNLSNIIGFTDSNGQPVNNKFAPLEKGYYSAGINNPSDLQYNGGINRSTGRLSTMVDLKNNVTNYDQLYNDYFSSHYGDLYNRYKELGYDDQRAMNTARDTAQRLAYQHIYDLGYRANENTPAAYIVPSLQEHIAAMEKATGNNYYTNKASFDDRYLNMVMGGIEGHDDRLFDEITSELAGNAYANQTRGTNYGTTPKITDLNNPDNQASWNTALQAAMSGSLTKDQILHLYDSQYSDLVIPEETKKWLASDSTHSLQQMFLNMGKNGGRLEVAKGTPEEYRKAYEAFINANPALKLMRDNNILSDDDIQMNFFKGTNFEDSDDDKNNKAYGRSGGYGRSSSSRGSGGGGGRGGSSYGSSGSGSGSSSKAQSTSRIHNIMKNWTF